jgi:hypothetical protein
VEERKRYGYRSLFWPVVLIGIGVVWLLGNLGLISWENVVVLFRLWPLLLIVIGLDLLVGRRSPWIGALIGLLAIAAVVGLMVFGPELGLAGDMEVKTDRFTEPIGGATSAAVTLGLSSDPATVTALADSDDLIDADLTYTGAIDFVVGGDREKTVRLTRARGAQIVFSDWGWLVQEDLHWDIGLTPNLPIHLTIDASSGDALLDLSQLRLTGLDLDVSSGDINLDLPATEQPFDIRVDGSSGDLDIDIPDGAAAGLDIDVSSGEVSIQIGDDADVDIRIDGSSGDVIIDVPGDAAVRLRVLDDSSGDVRVPARFGMVDDGDDDDEDTGTWETRNYGEAANRITITVANMSSGDIVVR